MPLTNAELEQCRRYLGFPMISNIYTTISTQVAIAESSNPASVDTLRGLLTGITNILNSLEEAAPYAGQSFFSGGAASSQHFRGEREMANKRMVREKVEEICSILNMNRYRDITVDSGQSWAGAVERG